MAKRISNDRFESNGAPNKLQQTGISVPLIDNLSHDAVAARPLKRSVGPKFFLAVFEMFLGKRLTIPCMGRPRANREV